MLISTPNRVVQVELGRNDPDSLVGIIESQSIYGKILA